ncbi:hypothetical protein QQF64_008463 [Cirrhinus molitorella]|uniref:Alpha-2-macroglobulin-like protein 1 n=1 Tax=Cirrhinus molitorella TaxID=172907 RepID=A0ABR3M8R3_9TELE
MLLSLLLPLLLLQWSLSSGATDPIYLVTVTSQAVGGSTETLCAQIHEPNEPLSIVVTLRTDNSNLTVLQQGSIKKDFYKCVPFKVPLVTVESVASVDVVIRGNKTFLDKTTKIVINPPQNLYFIQSDKPIYKPGQTIKFRIVSLDSNFLPWNQVFQTVELQDPYSNRIGQWLNQSTRIGILDLSHAMSPEAAQGYYTITAWDDKNQPISHSFEIQEYVLPKYEVNIDFPPYVTVKDKEVTLKVCAKYTYGKPVLGSVNAKVCVRSYDQDYYKPGFSNKLDACKEYSTEKVYKLFELRVTSMCFTGFHHFAALIAVIENFQYLQTDTTGCGSQVINVDKFGLPSGGFFQVNCAMEESGTGITMQGYTSAVFIHDHNGIRFKDILGRYRPGMIFKLKVKNQRGHQLVPVNNTGNSKEITVQVNFKLNKNGLAPAAHVVAWLQLPSGEIIPHNSDIPIPDCLLNVVSVEVYPTALPGEKTSLIIKAKPGSACSLRAIDQSVLLLRPEAKLHAVNGAGIKIPIYADMKAPDVYDIYENMFKNESSVYDVPRLNMSMGLAGLELGFDPEVRSTLKRTQKIRKFFPETWIWDLITMGKSGFVNISKMVPDTITKWAVEAYCTSPAGFGVAPMTYLTAFKPFFVRLTLPYSVIREETFTLKATVFNYLPKCIMVKVTLANSLQFTAQPCKGCTYTQCVCSDKSQTFQWIVTPSELGNVNIKVHAEAVWSQELCGNEAVTLPEKDSIDTVVQSVLVQLPLLRG